MTFFREELLKVLHKRLGRPAIIPMGSWTPLEHKHLVEGCSIVELADFAIKNRKIRTAS